MKRLFSIFFSSLLIFSFTACQDVVQIKLDEGSKLYVIDAFVHNIPGKQTIRVTTNDAYFSSSVAPPVPNAQVVLKDLTANKDFIFDYAGNGNYENNSPASDSLSRVNHQYQLNVTIDGVTYTSLTTQKRTASIDSVSANLFDGGGFGGPPEDPFYVCTLWAKDKVDKISDYYWVKTFRNDTLLSGINLAIDGTNGPVTDIPLDSVPFTPPITFLGFEDYQSGNTCRVEIHSLARDTYYFFIQAQAQINNGGLFATTPENVKTNIVTPKDAKVKAVGWFNMATVATKKITVP